MKSRWLMSIGVLGLVVGTGVADPVLYSGTGHYYEVVQVYGGIDWDAAKVAAEGLTYSGNPGYLATLTSAGEDTFVAGLVASSDNSCWLGGYQDPPDSTPPDANWRWVTDEPWDYTNWDPAEPNDWNGEQEDSLAMFAPPNPRYPKWFDHMRTANQSYVVEYVPEPTALGLVAMGGVALLRRKRGLGG
jgi:hypothetical protein